MTAQDRQFDPGRNRHLAGYRTLGGVPDELLDQDGNIRPVWRPFLDHFSALSDKDLARRFARGDQYLRDAGVFFRQYGAEGSTEREWPLARIPVLVEEAEWNSISAGLRQRADLLEAMVADLYGPNRLVANGHLPANLIAGSREWLRPMVNVVPRGGHFLHFLAFEIGRGPDGTWWVLGDRTQAPSGSGFALENRVATSRIYSDFFADSHVFRLAEFFRSFRDALHGLTDGPGARPAILTPGPLNDTYFEHAYIARYLGILLLEGEDLLVENGEVMVRTVDGLRPISVLWRRLDASFADPLELNPDSRLGTAGLVSAIRQGNVTMMNALGSGVLETRALMAFMPRIAPELLSAPLMMPNIATWWCGQPAEREHVASNRHRMMIGSAHSTRLPYESEETTVLGGNFRSLADEAVRNWLVSDGANLVGQEAVTLSTTPAYENGKLVPRPLSLRVFLARTGTGWQVMPGGFARIGQGPDANAIAMQRGGTVADVWVVSNGPVNTASVQSTPQRPYVRTRPTVLPSRSADNLFWLGRYTERAEGMMRLLRAYHVRKAESSTAGAALPASLEDFMKFSGIDPDDPVPTGLLHTINGAITSARNVRYQFSTDGWLALTDLENTARRFSKTLVPGDDTARAMWVLLRKITGFAGLVQENMYRFTGWRFLSIGRSLERAIAACNTLAVFTEPDAPDGSLDLAVELGDSVMTYRRRFSVFTSRDTVVDLLALDTRNPRSILYQLTEVRDQAAYLPNASVNDQMSQLSRAILEAHTSLAIQIPETLDADALYDIRSDFEGISDLIGETYLK